MAASLNRLGQDGLAQLEAIQAELQNFDVEPAYAERLVRRLLRTTLDPCTETLGHRCLGLIARSRGQYEQAIESFRQSVSSADAAILTAEGAQSRFLMATSLATVGNLPQALEELRRAMPLLSPKDHAASRNCEGFVLLNLERIAEARTAFNDAEGSARTHGQTATLAKILNNRSVLLIQAGEMARAQDDLEEAVRCFHSVPDPVNAAKAEHNLGWLFARQGLIVEALTAYRRADLQGGEQLSATCEGVRDRAELYLNARLLHEARHALQHAERLAAAQSLESQLPEIRLLLGRVLSCLGEFTASEDAFAQAESDFHAQTRIHGAQVAAFCRLLVTYDGTDEWSVETPNISGQLELHRSTIIDVACARLLAIRNEGHLEKRTKIVGTLSSVLVGGAESPNELTRAQSAVGAVVRGWEDLDRNAMIVGVDHLLQETERHLSFVNSAELRSVFIEVLGLEALIGDIAAVIADTDRFRRWTEQLRQCVAGRFSPLPLRDASPHQGEISVHTDEFRRSERSLSDSSNVVDITTATHNRCAAEFAIRSSNWIGRRGCATADRDLSRRTGGTGFPGFEGITDPESVVFLEYAGSSRTLVASVLPGDNGARDHRGSLIELGPINEVRARINSVRIASTALFNWESTLGEPDWRVDRFERAVQRLESLILPPELPEGPLVIVPNGLLGSVPWYLFEKLRGRPITLAPTKSDWRHFPPIRSDRAPIGIVAGPGLQFANDELEALAELYDDPVILRGPDATVASVCRLMNEVDILHVAAHGNRRTDSALFSGIELYDGALVAYDLLRVPRSPATVLLSCCDLGAANTTGACGLLGFTSTLRSRGSSQVAAAVLPIDDRSSRLAMTHLHRSLGNAGSLAGALADGVASAPTTIDRITVGSFVVVGGATAATPSQLLVS